MKKMDASHKILLICTFLFAAFIAINCFVTANSYKSVDVSDDAPLNITRQTATVSESAQDEENELININTAGVYELDRLPGIGTATAEKIIEYREKYGDFKSTNELMLVSGIGENKYENIRPYITVE